MNSHFSLLNKTNIETCACVCVGWAVMSKWINIHKHSYSRNSDYALTTHRLPLVKRNKNESINEQKHFILLFVLASHIHMDENLSHDIWGWVYIFLLLLSIRMEKGTEKKQQPYIHTLSLPLNECQYHWFGSLNVMYLLCLKTTNLCTIPSTPNDHFENSMTNLQVIRGNFGFETLEGETEKSERRAYRSGHCDYTLQIYMYEKPHLKSFE